MTNKTRAIRHTSFPASSEKRDRAIKMAQNRGKVAEVWLKDNKLNQSTIKEFQALMKKADRDFKSKEHE